MGAYDGIPLMDFMKSTFPRENREDTTETLHYKRIQLLFADVGRPALFTNFGQVRYSMGCGNVSAKT